jgi:RNA polymerase sigma-70 factor (ECF subfamily)
LLPTEQEIVAGCREGKRLFQRLLFEHYAPTMMLVCRRYTRDVMEAEDMLQEGFVKAFTKMDQFKDGSLEGWLRRIFVNTCLNNWKKHKDKKFIAEDHGMNSADNGEDGLQKLQTQQLLQLIDTLPHGAKVVFNLFAIEGYPHAEIAQMLQITEGGSRAQLTRARQLLKDKMLKMNLMNH